MQIRILRHIFQRLCLIFRAHPGVFYLLKVPLEYTKYFIKIRCRTEIFQKFEKKFNKKPLEGLAFLHSVLKRPTVFIRKTFFCRNWFAKVGNNSFLVQFFATFQRVQTIENFFIGSQYYFFTTFCTFWRQTRMKLQKRKSYLINAFRN